MIFLVEGKEGSKISSSFELVLGLRGFFRRGF